MIEAEILEAKPCYPGDQYITELLSGFDFFGDSFGGDEELRQRAWRLFREQILALWTKYKPGTRPWAWWHYDAPGSRLRLGGEGIACGEKTRFGVPCRWENIARDNPPLYESEAAFLSRYGLLADKERRALTEEDLNPKGIR